MNTRTFYKKIGYMIAVSMIAYIGMAQTTFAASIDELRSQIDDKQSAIEELEKEIAKNQIELNAISGQAQSLQKEVSTIDSTLRQLNSSVKLTQTKIDRAGLSISKNEEEITRLGGSIGSQRTVIGELVQNVEEHDSLSLFEFLLSGQSVSDFFGQYDSILKVQKSLRNSISTMRMSQQVLTDKQEDLRKEQEKLRVYRLELEDKKKIVEQSKKEKADILASTRNQESSYKAYLADLNTKRLALDAEIRSYESQLSFIIDPKQLPREGSQVLAWPLADTYITQRFGQTVDARRLYTSGSHSGIDFRAAVGTPVYAVADGTVEGVGDTDQTCRKTSFGKWVFIRHPVGLATAYGHLSLIKVSEGQKVVKGQLIAYSGNTGHTTGPHLHLSVYASHGVNGEDGAAVRERPSTTCPGRTYRMPLAPTSAYLDPLSYLPKPTQAMFKPTAY